MPSPWPTALVEELQKIDREETPHGLYGLRRARQTGPRLPKLISILTSPPIRLVQRTGGALAPRRSANDTLSFGLDNARQVRINLFDYADTKVRKFGNAYQLDKQTSVSHEPPVDLISELPKLAAKARVNYGTKSPPYSFGLLFIAHFQKEKDSLALLEKAISPQFLNRYGLSRLAAAWDDTHGRHFHTTIHLWYIEQPAKA